MAPSAPTDEDLALRAGRGDRAACGELVERYSVRVVRYLARSRGVLAVAAEDLAQEVWRKAWRNLPSRKPGPFRGWLLTIARNTAEDWRKLNARRRAKPLDATHPQPAGTDSVGQSAEIQEEVGRLRACLDRLAREFRAAFEGFVGGKT